MINSLRLRSSNPNKDTIKFVYFFTIKISLKKIA